MSTTRKTTWHIWIVGILTLLWNSFGAFDYVMTQTQNEAYMSAFSEEQLAYFYAMPTWYVISWSVAIWTAVLGSLLILFRSKFAVPVLALSLLGFIAGAVYSIFLYPMPGASMGNYIFSGVIFTILLMQFLYSLAMAKSGVLK